MLQHSDTIIPRSGEKLRVAFGDMSASPLTTPHMILTKEISYPFKPLNETPKPPSNQGRSALAAVTRDRPTRKSWSRRVKLPIALQEKTKIYRRFRVLYLLPPLKLVLVRYTVVIINGVYRYDLMIRRHNGYRSPLATPVETSHTPLKPCKPSWKNATHVEVCRSVVKF